MYAYESPDSPHAVAPGYCLAQGRLAGALPLVGLRLKYPEAASVAAARRRSADTALAARHGQVAERYAYLLGRSRGVVMKACQLLSLESLPPTGSPEHLAIYRSALSRSRGDTPSMPAGLAADLAETEFGLPLHEIFMDFDPHPIAAASIGQVHAARLQDGREVAVKIQYPGVERAIRADLRNGDLLASLLKLGCGMTCVQADVPAIARELAARIGEEIDYRVEATNQEAFAAAYRGHPLIRIPETVPELCTARVLTMDLSDGFCLARARIAPRRLRDRWGEVIYRFAVGSLTRLGMLNADPNPGNFLFHADGGVTFLDFGCVRRYSAKQIVAVQAVMQAIVESDPTQLLRVMTEAGYVDSADPPDACALMTWFHETHLPIAAEQPYTYSADFAAMLRGADLARSGRYAEVIRRLTIPADFLSVIRVNLGITGVLAELGATGHWAAIHSEYCGTAARRQAAASSEQSPDLV
jgi:predicted unusual protein kinase regulating ubiquinone biosynthesis (AarF/ABC1/UbiB family)